MMSGPQLSAVHAEVKRQVNIIIDQINLKKWAVDQAIAAGPATDDGLMLIARQIYDFVMETVAPNTDPEPPTPQ